MIRAVLESEGEKYSEGYTLVTREDLGSFYYYQPARQRVSVVDVQAPHDLKVGYIMGAGDDIPTVLKQVGMDVTLIPAEKIATRRSEPVRNDCAGDSRLRHAERCGRRIIRSCSILFPRAERWWCSTTRRWGLQRGQVHALSGGVEPGAGFGGGGSGGHSGAGGFRVSFSQYDYGARFRWVGAGARIVLHGASGTNISRRCCPAMIRAKRRRRAGCCGRSTARGFTFTRDMRFSGSCRRECRERCGCL